MSDAALSQEEIDALLTGVGGETSNPASQNPSPTSSGLSPTHLETFKDDLTKSQDALMSSMTSLIGKSCSISSMNVSLLSKDNAIKQLKEQSVIVHFKLGSSNHVAIVSGNDAKKLATNMMGLDIDLEGDLNDAHLSTISEFINIFGYTINTSLAEKYQDNLTPEVVSSKVYKNEQDISTEISNDFVVVTYNYIINNQQGKVLYYLDTTSVQNWMNKSQPQSDGADLLQNFNNLDDTNMSGVSYPNLEKTANTSTQNADLPPNYNLLLDVQMNLTVELGRTTKYIKDILNLGEGSIIELDKLAGEPVDLLINGKLIAKGEVVVIDENFGVRLTDIVAPADRIPNMNDY